MLTKNTPQMIALMQNHYDHDTIRGGQYDHGDGSFCNIGCLANGENGTDHIQSEYGIPLNVMRIQESIFEALPTKEQPQFALDCAKAIEVDGKDLSLVMPNMLVAILSRLPKKDFITTVIDLYKRVIAGENISDMNDEFNAARSAARSAADAAAYAADAAAYAARAAAYAARAAADAAAYAADAAYAARAAAYAVRAAAYAAARAAGAAERQLQKEDLLRFLKDARHAEKVVG